MTTSTGADTTVSVQIAVQDEFDHKILLDYYIDRFSMLGTNLLTLLFLLSLLFLLGPRRVSSWSSGASSFASLSPSSAASSSVTSAVSSRDAEFHAWCSSVGITTPLARLETTPKSVAGRGVFASANIQEGDVVITIPEDIVLHEFNAAASFPDLAQTLWKKCARIQQQQQQFEEKVGRRCDKEKVNHDHQEFHPQNDGRSSSSFFSSWWSKLFRGRRRRHDRRQGNAQEEQQQQGSTRSATTPSTFQFTDSSDLWQGMLTSFCLATLKAKEEDHHPWSPWLSQWQRSDPMQSLFEKGATWRDEGDVCSCVEELSTMLPDVSKVKLRAAVEMRLGRLEELKTIFDVDKEEELSLNMMYGVLTSRAIELGDGVVGVLPMFDMINHSNEPNLALSYGDEKFSLWATRDIMDGEELFVSYKDRNTESLEEWDEDDAIWMLVQWGIPMPKPQCDASVRTTGSRTTTTTTTKQLLTVA